MRFPFKHTREDEETWLHALDSLRFVIREVSKRKKVNPFARPAPSPLGDPRFSAEIIKLF
ncbi:MAG: hypothetical protein AAF830_10740 [Pseudomonadota bacterium]